MLTTLLLTLEIKFVLKIESNSWGFNGFFIIKQIEKLMKLMKLLEYLGSG